MGMESTSISTAVTINGTPLDNAVITGDGTNGDLQYTSVTIDDSNTYNVNMGNTTNTPFMNVDAIGVGTSGWDLAWQAGQREQLRTNSGRVERLMTNAGLGWFVNGDAFNSGDASYVFDAGGQDDDRVFMRWQFAPVVSARTVNYIEWLLDDGTEILVIDSDNDFSTPNSFQLGSVTAGITASTTQSQGQGALTSQTNEVSTVGTTNDVVTLPSAKAGRECTIINNGANTLQIFPASGDNLGSGVDTSTTLTAGSKITYHAYDNTNWR